jgi:phytoene dehydrogenase-like protein
VNQIHVQTVLASMAARVAAAARGPKGSRFHGATNPWHRCGPEGGSRVLLRGGAQRVASALAAHVRSLGGEIVTYTSVKSIDELPPAKAILCDLSPQPLLRIAGHRFPLRFRGALKRYRCRMSLQDGLGTRRPDPVGR